MAEQKPVILIVDDEIHICSVLSAYLEENGFDPLEAHDLATARRLLKEGARPDIVLCDVMLGDGNGILFAREIRANPAMGRVPIIMMSAHRTKSQDKVLGLEFGADDYLIKPFDLRELLLRIEKLLKNSSLSEQNRDALKKVPIQIGDRLAEELRDVLKREPATSQKSAVPLQPVLSSPATPLQASPALGDSVASWDPQAVSPATAERKTFLPEPTSLINAGRDLFLRPQIFFKKNNPSERSWLALLFVGATGILWGLQHGLSARSWGVGFVGAIAYPVILAGAVAFTAWLIQWVAGFRGRSIPVKQAMSALGVAFAPLALAASLGFLYVLFAQGRFGDFTAGLLLFFPDQSSSQLLGFALRRLDAFEIWAVVIAVSALRSDNGGARGVWIRRSILIWFGLVFIGTAVRMVTG